MPNFSSLANLEVPEKFVRGGGGRVHIFSQCTLWLAKVDT